MSQNRIVDRAALQRTVNTMSFQPPSLRLSMPWGWHVSRDALHSGVPHARGEGEQ